MEERLLLEVPKLYNVQSLIPATFFVTVTSSNKQPFGSAHSLFFFLMPLHLNISWTLPHPHSRLPCLWTSPSCLTPLSSVPFLESPKYVPKRRESAHTLPLLQSHHLLRANSDNTMTQSDPLVLPIKAATNPNPGQVRKAVSFMVSYNVSINIRYFDFIISLFRAIAEPPSAWEAPAAPELVLALHPEGGEAKVTQRRDTGSHGADRGELPAKKTPWGMGWFNILTMFL